MWRFFPRILARFLNEPSGPSFGESVSEADKAAAQERLEKRLASERIAELAAIHIGLRMLSRKLDDLRDGQQEIMRKQDATALMLAGDIADRRSQKPG